MHGPQTVLYAATIHTLTQEQEITALGITDGVISHLGNRDQSRDWLTADTEIIDHGDAAITPGLVDAHIHPVFGQSVTRGIFLGDARTVEEATHLFAEYARTRESDQILLGHGLNVAIFGSAEPNGQFLEAAAPGRSSYVTCFDAHSALASQAMLQLADISGTESFTDGSSVVVDLQGNPTGFLREFAAMALVESSLPVLSIDDKVHAVYRLLREMAASGLTGGEMLDFADPDSLEVFRRLEQYGELPIKLRIAPWLMASDGAEALERIIDLQGQHGRRWQVRGAKLMIDGTVDNGTAWLYEPDTEGESTDSLYLDPKQYLRNLNALAAAGITTTTHAIGDRGIGFVISAIAALPKDGLRHRIEHLEEINDEDFARLQASGATISMQPTHCTHFVRADGSDAWSRRLGERRAQFAFRLRDVKDAGLVLALGSDWPIAPFDPRLIMADAQTRRRTEVPDSDSAQPRHRLSAREALEGYTANVYESTGTTGGRLTLGMPADLSVFAADPLAISPEELCTVEVLGTYLDGVRVDTHAELDSPEPLPASAS
ncbi:amidohydrolase [Arthrobacter sp. MYb211]|uniref:amidohydrolase n=1 Tax=unclassified Arthrobacter TaxID=235627 RepID=UPI000CFBBC5A|nr:MULTISPECIES: amidohydrolase family protein [unclassified Arthrobacter]PRA11592.1 amidohydrolase [Arthrobacter sp. MYb221]PRC07905.1 amidohydrolase [Arthrobacter sp. MYb211]